MEKISSESKGMVYILIFVAALVTGYASYKTCGFIQCTKTPVENQMSSSVAIYSIFKVDYPIYENSVVIPLQAGRAFHHPSSLELESRMIGDDTGINISLKNDRYAELTALYWIWKNAPKRKYIGIMYPYRYFINEFLPEQCEDVLDVQCTSGMSEKYIKQLMSKYDIVVPLRRNLGVSTYNVYNDLYYITDLNTLVDYVKEKYPSMSVAVDNVLNSHFLIEKNMFIMRQDLFDEYMAWMFDILFALEEKFSHDYRGGKTQTPLYLSEYLFNFWIEYNITR